MGYNIMGYSIKMKNDLSSIPGLKLWLDGRYGKNIVDVGGIDKVSLWRDLSSSAMVFSKTGTTKLPTNDSKFVIFENNSVQTDELTSIPVNLDALHLGTFGFYFIGSINLISGMGVPQLLLTSSNTSLLRMYMRYIELNKSLNYRIENSAGAIVVNFESGNNSIVEDTLMRVGLVRTKLTGSNGIRFYINDVNTATSSDNDVGDGSVEQVKMSFPSNADGNIKYGMSLFYDWTGYTESEITVFDARVRSILSSIMSEFV